MLETVPGKQNLQLISGEGALLLFLPRSLCNQWSGSIPPTNRLVEAEFRWAGQGSPATDYDRACDVKGYIEPISVGKGEGIVITDDYPALWMPSLQGGMFLRTTDLVQDLLPLIPLMTEEMWSDTLFEYDAKDTQFVLFDPAYAGNQIEEMIEIELEMGRYNVSTLERTIEGAPLLVHRLVRQPSTAAIS